MKPLYSKAELADLFGVSITTIDRAVKSGRLRFVRVEGRKRFTYDDVLAYLNRGESHRSGLSAPQRTM